MEKSQENNKESPRQTPLAQIALNDYLHLGMHRSTRQLHEKYLAEALDANSGEGGKQKLKSPVPTMSLSTLENWRHKHKWVERAAEWDAEQLAEQEAQWQERRSEIREDEWTTGDKLRDIAKQILAKQS